jgi:conjugative transfer pilus assembly protein TraH
MKLKLTVAAVALSLSPTLLNAGGLQSQLDGVFGQMTNVTPPGVYESQRRGVLSGGRFTTKSKIYDTNLVAFTPPSWKAGCGGVDLFGGSFSFINAEQLVQLLRAVAANAKGYAFQLALDNVFPDGAKWIESFQKKIQELNQHLGNSCQLAQGFVNDLTSGMDLKNKTDASLMGSANGLFEDFFSTKQETGGKTPIKEIRDQSPEVYKRMTGNILWKTMKQNYASSWFTYGDTELLETIMSMTGSIVVGDMVNDKTGTSSGEENTNPIITLPGGLITLKDLIQGGNLEIYTCNGDDQCYSPTTKRVTIKGMRTKIVDLLHGGGTTPGVIYKYATNSGVLSETEKAFTTSMPSGMGAIIRNLSIVSYDSAVLFANDSADAISLVMMKKVVDDFFRVALAVISSSDSANKKQLLDEINISKSKFDSDYSALRGEYGDLSKIIDRYRSILEISRKQKYALSTLTSAPKP